jgi:hypothetical protein
LPKAAVVGETAALGTPPPVPLSETVWLEAVLLALSLMVSVALREPAAVGEKVTEIEQLPPIATLPAQLLVVAKSPAFVPLIPMLEIVNTPVPPLERVTVCAVLVVPTLWLPKVSVVGEGVAAGIPTPVPEIDTLCVDPVVLFALSVTVSVAVRVPVLVGLNVTEMVQLPAAATAPAQLLVVL